MAAGPATSFLNAPGAAELDLTRFARAGLGQSSRFFGRVEEGKACPDWPVIHTRLRSAESVPPWINRDGGIRPFWLRPLPVRLVQCSERRTPEPGMAAGPATSFRPAPGGAQLNFALRAQDSDSAPPVSVAGWKEKRVLIDPSAVTGSAALELCQGRRYIPPTPTGRCINCLRRAIVVN